MLAAVCVFGLFALVCAVVGSRLHRVSSSHVEDREAWGNAEGEVFARPQWFFPLIVGGIILNGFLALVAVGARCCRHELHKRRFANPSASRKLHILSVSQNARIASGNRSNRWYRVASPSLSIHRLEGY